MVKKKDISLNELVCRKIFRKLPYICGWSLCGNRIIKKSNSTYNVIDLQRAYAVIKL